MAHTIIFLGGASQLVFLDNALIIFLTTGDSHKSSLNVVAHDLPIKIKTRIGVQNERALIY